jgi:hypothetical protein
VQTSENRQYYQAVRKADISFVRIFILRTGLKYAKEKALLMMVWFGTNQTVTFLPVSDQYSNNFYQILDIRIQILIFSSMNIFGYFIN